MSIAERETTLCVIHRGRHERRDFLFVRDVAMVSFSFCNHENPTREILESRAIGVRAESHKNAIYIILTFEY